MLNELFLKRAKKNRVKKMDSKFRAGYKEHGAGFMNMSKAELIDEIDQEVTDLTHYIERLKELNEHR